MNWFTIMMTSPNAEQVFGALGELAGRGWDERLRIVPFWALSELFRFPEGSSDLTDSFLLCEESEYADERRRRAVSAQEPQTADTFTLALDAGQGTVFYLPERSSDELSLQLFTSYGGLIGIVNARAELGDELNIALLGQPQRYNPALAGDCSAGPCEVWGGDCSPPELGCACHLEAVSSDFAYGRSVLASPVQGWTYKCVRP